MCRTECIDTFEPAAPSWSEWARTGLWLLNKELVRIAGVAETWADRRRTRRTLMTMDDRTLSDIGIGRAEADGEGRKPGWED